MRKEDEERGHRYQMKRRACRGDRVITTVKMAMAPATSLGRILQEHFNAMPFDYASHHDHYDMDAVTTEQHLLIWPENLRK
uniref:Uncharacterized protein n=1 Tax=Oryza sativa subsp. japonica TaxID=39947 RepID=Q2R2R6_ORYSJ|nr:hypothetical protein LOC_Os11g34900 [Oryza sativa Japonica Group]